MKTFRNWLATACIMLASVTTISCTQNGNGNGSADKEPEPEIEVPKEFTEFFSTYLKGKTKTCTTSTPIELSAVEESRALVWEAWKQANKSLNEEKLIPLEALSAKKSGSWHLPAELEPNATMNYYWGSKGEGRPEEGYPLFLYTHGSGHKDREWETGWTICQRFDDAPSVYFIPQIPNMGDYYRWWQKAKQFAWEKLLRQAFVSDIVNPDRVYVFGISEGGYGSQRLASFYADYWAGAGPMAGGEPLNNAPVENCRNIAFSLLTGAEDDGFCRNDLTARIKEEFDSWESKYPGQFKHRIELIPGRGHGIDYNPTTPWLKVNTRNPYPKNISWENFEMDGQYRDGFYNLYVLERSNPNYDSRTYYEMDIHDNQITISVQLVTYEAVERDPRWGIPLRFKKNLVNAETGKFLVYLSPELVDMSKPVIVNVNGKLCYNGMVEPDLMHMLNSCAHYFDPRRVYPAAVEVDLKALQ